MWITNDDHNAGGVDVTVLPSQQVSCLEVHQKSTERRRTVSHRPQHIRRAHTRIAPLKSDGSELKSMINRIHMLSHRRDAGSNSQTCIARNVCKI